MVGTNREVFLHGGDYNPEQWLDRPDILQEDVRLMAEAGVNYVNLGVFAWSALEPREGTFDFDWLDNCFERLHAHGVAILLATPTAARPLWMAHKYPEVRLTRRDGSLDPIGNRHNYCWSSTVFREKGAALVARLSKRYGEHPALLGWHLNNEFGGYADAARCYCHRCLSRFHDWLRERYDGDLEKLNRRWWTRFWSHDYQDWSQILPTDDSVEGLALNWRRFSSAQVVDFIRHELTAIRTHSAAPVAHNLHSVGTLVDEFLVSKELDFVGFDSYPQVDGTPADLDAMVVVAWDGARMRGHCPGRPWLLMESCPRLPQWHRVMRAKRPGVHRVLSLQNIASGADGIGYFQWRAGRGSVEKLHGAVLMQDAPTETRVFREVAELGRELADLATLKGTRVPARVAILWDAEQEWAWECSHGLESIPSPRDRTLLLFRLLWEANIPVDVCSPRSDFAGYDLVLAHGVFLLPPGFEQRLASCVGAGATVVIDALTGWVDDDLRIPAGGRPGPVLRTLFGIETEEFDCLRQTESIVIRSRVDLLPNPASGVLYCDRIRATHAEVEATIDDAFHGGWPAMTVCEQGRGRFVYQATGLGVDAARHFLKKACGHHAILPPFPGIPDGLVVNERSDDDRQFFFVLNPHYSSARLPLPVGFRDVRTDAPSGTVVSLGPWDARILCRKTRPGAQS